MRTGIFFYYQTGDRLRDFPAALAGIMDRENVYFYDAFYPSKPPSSFELEPIPIETLYRVHSREMVETVRKTGDFDPVASFDIAVRMWCQCSITEMHEFRKPAPPIIRT